MLYSDRTRRNRITVPAAALAIALTAAACGGGGGTDESKVTSDESATLTVWTDDTRQPAVEAYVKAHPDAKVKVVLTNYGPGEIPQKIALADKAGKGWPDVVFLGAPSDVSALAAAPLNFAQPLNDLVPETTRKQFTKEPWRAAPTTRRCSACPTTSLPWCCGSTPSS